MARTANAAATVPEPCQIIGTTLAPFCLGHHLLFKRLGLPFEDAPLAEASTDQIILGIAICAGQSYEHMLSAHLDGSWEATFKRWTERVKGPWWKRRRVHWESSEALFRAYLQDGYALPPVWRDKGTSAGSIKLTAPWEQILKCKLVSSGFSESEVLNGYLPGRWYDFYTLREQESASKCTDARGWKRTFYTDEDEQLVRMGINYAEGRNV